MWVMKEVKIKEQDSAARKYRAPYAKLGFNSVLNTDTVLKGNTEGSCRFQTELCKL